MIKFINGKKFLDIITKHTLWDKKTAQLLVTNTNSVEVRVTLCAENANDTWNVSC